MAFESDAIRLLLAVLDHGSFSAAGRALGRVPSAISMAVANLEAELDIELFDRSGREPVPTAAARALEPQARAIANGLRQLDAHALALHAGLERRLGLAVASELLSAAWSEPLLRLAEEFPALEVDVVSGPQDEMLRLLHAGEVQLALVFERPAIDDREAFQEVAQENLIAVAAPSHPLVRGPHRPQLADLVAARQVAVARRAPAASDPRLILARTTWRTDSHLAALRLVEAGLGWALLPEAMAAGPVAAGALVAIAFDGATNELRLWVDVVWRTDRPLGLAARRYIEHIRAARARR